MRNITQPDNLNKYYMYKGYFIEWNRHDGTYSTYTSRGCLRANTQKAIKELINKDIKELIREESTMEKSERMTGYNELKAWMERQYGASHAKVNITCNGKTYTGHMYGNDDCFDGNEFYQFLLTDTALLRIYYDIPEGCTDLSNIDYDAPYDVRAEDAQYWIDYVI